MPPLTLHMALANDAMEALREAPPISNLGAYYLGATTPDIRVLTRWERGRTHFFDIHSYEPQSSVDRLFEEFPELARPERLNPATVSFVAGYISHLRLDELYIEGIYRPYFGGRPSGPDQVAGNLMDRILQYELDRRRREDPELMAHLREEMLNAPLDIKVAFLDAETLERWRQVAAEVVAHPPDWQGFRRVASRHLKEAGIATEGELDAFLKDVPRLLDETIEHVRPQRVDAFLERCVEAAADTLVRYFDCA